MKIVKVILSREALEVYNNLKSSSLKNNIILLKSIESKFSLLKENPQLGNPIKKRMIPFEYIKK